MSTVGRKLLSSLVRTKDIQAYIRMGLEPYLFKETELELYNVLSSHISKYGAVPAQSTIEELPGLEDALVEAPEPPDYYLDEVEKRYLHTTLKSTVQEASMLLATKHSEAALDVIMKTSALLYRKRKRNSIFDFRDAEEVIHQAYIAQKTMGPEIALPFGWPTLDNMSGGMRAGDFVTFVGRPMAGKTFKVLHTCMNAWRLGRAPLVVSMEMMTLIMAQRLTAMHSKKKLTDLMKAELSSKAFTSMMKDLHDLKFNETPFTVVDGSMASTPDDVVHLCNLFGPSVCAVDGAYLLGSNDKKLNKWDMQAENARQLKQRVATDLGIPVVASYQLSKGSAKEKKKSKTPVTNGMEDVYGSDEMAQLSTVMLGLFDNEDAIEAKRTRKVEILKGRNGETGSFTINWDFSARMDFSEYVAENPEDVQMDFMG